MTIKISVSVLAIIFTLAFSQLYGQTRISFAKGQTSRTVSRIFPASRDNFEWEFVLRGKAGQTMTATVRSRTGGVVFQGMGKTRSWQLRDNDTSLFLINDGRATRFWLTVTIR